MLFTRHTGLNLLLKILLLDLSLHLVSFLSNLNLYSNHLSALILLLVRKAKSKAIRIVFAGRSYIFTLALRQFQVTRIYLLTIVTLVKLFQNLLAFLDLFVYKSSLFAGDLVVHYDFDLLLIF